MTAMTAVWIASCAGALLFFVAGFLSARARVTPAVARAAVHAVSAPAVEPQDDSGAWRAEADRLRESAQQASAELARLRHTADEARAEAARLGSVADEARAEAARLRSSADQARAEAGRQRAEMHRLEAALAGERKTTKELRGELARLREADAKLVAERDQGRQHLLAASEAVRKSESLERRVEELTAERDQVAAARDELRGRADVLERRLAEAEGAGKEVDELRQRLAAAERGAAAASELAAAEAKRQELLVELEVAKNRAAELAHLEEENATLKSAVEERAALQQRVTELTAEVANLRAQGLSRARRPSIPPLPRNRAARGTEDSLQSLLNGVHSVPGMRSAVLGDELGLPIVGLGDHSSQLAAFGGFMDGISAKMSEFLPMDGVRRIHVEDEHGATVSAFPLAMGEARLVLVTLTVDGLPATAQMTSILRSAATMVQ